MIYTSHSQISSDLDYANTFKTNRGRFGYDEYERGEYVSPRELIRLRNIWNEHMNEKFENSKLANNTLGKFINEYKLKFKEVCCLLDLIDSRNEKSDFEMENRHEEKDHFKDYKIRFESSALKRHKLIYKIVNPLRPMKVVYEVAYKAQLGIQGKRYTDEYEQLDLVLEEESKLNTPDQLESLYYLSSPKVSLNDLIVSKELKDKIRSAIVREEKKDLIMKRWGIGKIIEYGKGTTLNFRGPPGTGKTMAANTIAKQLNKKLLMVRYDQLQNLYVGETEKNIQRVFKIASTKKAVLFFDEADAVAHNRASLEKSWEMSQVNTLLKELERFEGICVFATNFAEKYDPAFERRLTMHIDFELPNKNQAIQILNNILPKKARHKKLSLENLKLDGLSGGDIKNIVLNSAGIAAFKNAEKIEKNHIEKAIEQLREAKQEKGEKLSYMG